jgi:hypothetical protein
LMTNAPPKITDEIRLQEMQRNGHFKMVVHGPI